jgi:CRISPR-associated DxTHG motif protein
MRKVITFLGTYPRETTYRYEGQVYDGRVFAEALCQFLTFDEMLVFTTPEAKEKAWPILRDLDDPRLCPVAIPIGRNEEELWTIFTCLTQEVAAADAVVFDITHGLRSIPFLVFLAAAYLKEARNVSIERIIYGAYELGQPAPVVDLSDFAGLLDWLTATHRFTQLGDGQPLADLLREQEVSGSHEPALDPARPSEVLGDAAAAIESVSLALSVTRPLEAMESAERLTSTLGEAREVIAADARPFALLSDRVRDSYALFALDDPMKRSNWRDNLCRQFAMMRWYLDKEQIVQAATLAREWLVSTVAYCVGAESLTDLQTVRFPIAHALNNASLWEAGRAIYESSRWDSAVFSLPAFDVLIDAWDAITGLRNDIAHVGMNEHPDSAHSLCQQMSDLLPKLDELARVLLSGDLEIGGMG